MHGVLAHGLTHAAIIDFDLHHGDGSQAITWAHNKRGLPKNVASWKKTPIGYFSLHDINSYPCEWGDEEKVKNASLCIDNAHGQNIWNVHLQEWKTEVDFWRLYQSRYSVLLEKARNFLRLQTERLRAAGQVPKAAIFLSAGFDASEWEGVGMQRHKVNVPTEFYARITRDVVKMASEEGLGVEGRIISVLEGGYSDRALYSGASEAKLTEIAKIRRSVSGVGVPSGGHNYNIPRVPTPPPPDVPWTAAAHELSKLLVPNDRQINSCKHEELNTEATKAKQKRQSLNSAVKSENGDAEPAIPSRPSTRMSLRERKPTNYTDPDSDIDKARRKTVGGALATEKANARGKLPSQNETKLLQQPRSTSGATSKASSDNGGDLDNITNGMKRIKINVLTKEKKEARQREAAEKKAASERATSEEAVSASPFEEVPIPTIMTPTIESNNHQPHSTGNSPEAAAATAQTPDPFVPYHPDGPPAAAIPLSGPVRILDPNTGTPASARPHSPRKQQQRSPSKAAIAATAQQQNKHQPPPPPPQPPLPFDARVLALSPDRKGYHGFTATSPIPFAAPRPTVAALEPDRNQNATTTTTATEGSSPSGGRGKVWDVPETPGLRRQV
ncbi:putative histone deacetylase hos3 protein [Eutypa lata UCREL1]|uniref:Putative histone deacetylase hos3 protein n=1 Tax=Eutypa lata (strain UCR-EL1) TaxID=1287681 RepID=M7SIN2_EUTLA|nr:putative histone deacetylase hos3 protein [Eutypa lata UCREL1]